MLDDIVVTDIINAMTVYSKQGRKERIVKRKSYALTFSIEGQITYKHNGMSYVSKPGFAVILPKDQTYILVGDKKGVFPIINFETKDVLCTSHVCIPLRENSSFISCFEELRTQLVFKNNKVKAMSIFYNIIDKLTASQNENDILFPAIDYIDNNYFSSDLNNQFLAKLCNISEVYFRKLFLKRYKTTPKQYIIDVRLNKSKELLSDGRYSVGSIAEMCGFTNPYHFSRTFKARIGITPLKYMIDNKVYKI